MKFLSWDENFPIIEKQGACGNLNWSSMLYADNNYHSNKGRRISNQFVMAYITDGVYGQDKSCEFKLYYQIILNSIVICVFRLFTTGSPVHGIT